MPAQGRGAFLPPPKSAPKIGKLPATPMRSSNPVAAANAHPELPKYGGVTQNYSHAHTGLSKVPKAPAKSSGGLLSTLEHGASEVGKGIGEGASAVGHEISALAQARLPETPGGSQATRELLKPVNKANEKLQSPATARSFAKTLRAGGINVPQEDLEKIGKSLGRLPEDIAYMPKGTVEGIIHPVKGAEQFADLAKETIKHPTEHADFITMLGVPALNRLSGKADIAGAAEDTGVGSVKVRPMAKTKGALRKPTLEPPATPPTKLAKRVLGGPVKAGRIDTYVGSQRQVEHLQRSVDENGTLKHTSKDKAVNEALVPYGEGLIKPSDRVGSASKRIAAIKAGYKDLGERSKLEADRQLQVYEKIKNFTPKQHEEALKLSEGQRAFQAPKSEQAAYEGVIKPQQLKARFMGFALTHGDELGHGPLRVRKGAISPLIHDLREVNDKIAQSQREFEQAKIPGQAQRLRAAVADLHDRRDAIESQLKDSHGADAVKKLKIRDGRVLTKEGSGLLHDHIVDANNQHVPWRDIEKLYYSHGHKNPPLYVSQISKALSSDTPGKIRGIPTNAKPRTGVNVQRGTYNTSLDNLRRSNIATGNTIAKAMGDRGKFQRFAHGEGSLEQMDKAAKAFNADPANKEFIERFGPMVRTSRGPDRFLRSPAGREGPNWLDAGVQAEMRAKRQGPGKYTLLPEKVFNRFQDHKDVEELSRKPWTSPVGTLVKSTGAFKKAVLILNPHWWAGVPMEYMVRGLMGNRVGMKAAGEDYLTKLRAVSDNPSMPSHTRFEATRLAASFDQGKTLGGWVGDLMESNNINDIMRPQQSKWGALMDRTPKGLRLWSGAQEGVAKWLHYVEKTNNRKILGQIAHDQIKQTAKETRDLSKDMGKIHDQWLEGKLNPNEADDVVERLIRVAGNWHHLTPQLKELRMLVLPFGMWTVNAMTYMLKVMPRDYPGRTMLLVALSQGAPREHLPLYLQGTLGSVNILGHQARPDPFYYLPTSLGREAGVEKGQPHLGLLEGTNPILAAAALSKANPLKFGEGVGETLTPAAGQLKRAVTAKQGAGFGLLKAFSPLRFTPAGKTEETKKKKSGSFGSGKFGGGSFGGGYSGKF